MSVAAPAPLMQIHAGLLSVSYAQSGPADGPAVILLHGWPYDVSSFADVAPILASAGYRVIVPFARGYGPTRFLSADTLRNGQQAVLAVDVVALMESRIIKGGVGHNLPQEAPQDFAQAILDVDRYS